MNFDLNVLRVIDALLDEGSVTGAAKRLAVSKSAVSRSLALARAIVHDPIMVRAGSRLVPTDRAVEMKAQVRAIIEGSSEIMRPQSELDLAALNRVFKIRANDALIASIGPRLHEQMCAAAPQVKLLFAAKSEKVSRYLRDGMVDLEIGVVSSEGPEFRLQYLFRDKFVGVVREDHPLTRQPINPESYAGQRHVATSRRGIWYGPIDSALKVAGHTRNVAMIVPNFETAVMMARHTDFVASLPDLQTRIFRADLVSFDLPVQTDPVVVHQMWHPRHDTDYAHRWLRACIKSTCRQFAGSQIGDDQEP